MARRKRGSRTLTRAEKRLVGLKSINPKLDLGNDLTVARFASVIADFQQKLDDYNSVLHVADALRLEVADLEVSLAALTEKMLVGVAHQFGKDSYEYAQAGGVKKSARKPPTRQSTAPAVG
jgi:hypothetical protein